MFEIDKDFRGCHLHITVKNPGHAESGCKKLFVNGQEMKDNYIPQTVLTDETDIELIMSYKICHVKKGESYEQDRIYR